MNTSVLIVDAKGPSEVGPGNVFAISIRDGRHQIGQIIGEYKSAFFVVVFDFIAESMALDPVAVSEALRSEPLVIDTPMVLKKAVRAMHGIEPWRPFMDELRYTSAPTSAEVFAS